MKMSRVGHQGSKPILGIEIEATGTEKTVKSHVRSILAKLGAKRPYAHRHHRSEARNERATAGSSELVALFLLPACGGPPTGILIAIFGVFLAVIR
jgi:hypothetical protein